MLAKLDIKGMQDVNSKAEFFVIILKQGDDELIIEFSSCCASSSSGVSCSASSFVSTRRSPCEGRFTGSAAGAGVEGGRKRWDA